MHAILDMFAFLNSAIDGGVMTQKAFSIAVLGLGYRIHSDWHQGTIPADRLPQFSHELQQLDGHWRAHCEAVSRPRLAYDAAQLSQAIVAPQPIVVTAAMKRAGVAAIEQGRGLCAEELATRIFRAMAAAA
ncbi:MAG: hypothetical protein ABS35_21970 [Kaistia sp. SCN 65-12]|nr:MAG: hypothetical protein ABS35_21970 [Kaistia sp. SCN 65-12]